MMSWWMAWWMAWWMLRPTPGAAACVRTHRRNRPARHQSTAGRFFKPFCELRLTHCRLDVSAHCRLDAAYLAGGRGPGVVHACRALRPAVRHHTPHGAKVPLYFPTGIFLDFVRLTTRHCMMQRRRGIFRRVVP